MVFQGNESTHESKMKTRNHIIKRTDKEDQKKRLLMNAGQNSSSDKEILHRI